MQLLAFGQVPTYPSRNQKGTNQTILQMFLVFSSQSFRWQLHDMVATALDALILPSQISAAGTHCAPDPEKAHMGPPAGC